MLIPINQTKPIFSMCDEIVEKVLGMGYELDRAHTRPNGWIRFIDPEDCRNIGYFNYAGIPNSNELFEFDVDQDDDIWLKKAKRLFCVCGLGERLLVVEVNNDALTFTIGIVGDEPKLFGHGVGATMIRYFWVVNADHE